MFGSFTFILETVCKLNDRKNVSTQLNIFNLKFNNLIQGLWLFCDTILIVMLSFVFVCKYFN